MICDEVQSGIFRTGLPYGFQNFGVLPDIVTMAKGIASGVVAGACAAKSSIAAAFAPGRSRHPPSAARTSPWPRPT